MPPFRSYARLFCPVKRRDDYSLKELIKRSRPERVQPACNGRFRGGGRLTSGGRPRRIGPAQPWHDTPVRGDICCRANAPERAGTAGGDWGRGSVRASSGFSPSCGRGPAPERRPFPTPSTLAPSRAPGHGGEDHVHPFDYVHDGVVKAHCPGTAGRLHADVHRPGCYVGRDGPRRRPHLRPAEAGVARRPMNGYPIIATTPYRARSNSLALG